MSIDQYKLTAEWSPSNRDSLRGQVRFFARGAVTFKWRRWPYWNSKFYSKQLWYRKCTNEPPSDTCINWDGCQQQVHRGMNRLVYSENDDKCTVSSDGKYAYRWSMKHTLRRASERTPRSATMSSPSRLWTSSTPPWAQERWWDDTPRLIQPERGQRWIPKQVWTRFPITPTQLPLRFRMWDQTTAIWLPNWSRTRLTTTSECTE
jgi:hypothetical protein